MDDQRRPDRSRSAGLMSSQRVGAFSDGVFAIAITLLVLDLGVPPREELREGGLAAALAHQWPSYLAYLVSFLIIGIIWVNHHTVFDKVRFVDRPVLFANLAVLLTTSVIPFPTHLLANTSPPAATHTPPRPSTARRCSPWAWPTAGCGSRSPGTRRCCTSTSTPPPAGRRCAASGSAMSSTSPPSGWPSSARSPPWPCTARWRSTTASTSSPPRVGPARPPSVPARPIEDALARTTRPTGL